MPGGPSSHHGPSVETSSSVSRVSDSDGYLLWVKSTLSILGLTAPQACQSSSHEIVMLGLYIRNFGLFQDFFFLL